MRTWNIVITPDETGGFVAECIDLPGCFSQGETIAETRSNIKAAIRDCLEVLRARALREGKLRKNSRLIRIAA